MKCVPRILALVMLLLLAGCVTSGQFHGSISTAGIAWHSETDLDLRLTDPEPLAEPQP